jgi:uncharacterized protein (TIGR03118 family)
MFRQVVSWMLATFLLVVAASTVSAQASSAYKQTNLISDVPGTAAITDSHVVNPWGIAASSTSPFWISDNGSGVSTLYNGTGQPFPVGSPLVVTIPPPKGSPAGTTAAPTGVVFNSTSDFSVSHGSASGPAQFLFSTEDGTISGWNANVNRTAAILAVDNSAGSGTVYKGLTLGGNASGNFIFAANFRAGTVDVFDHTFKAANLAGHFSDPNLPAGFAPFGIQNVNGNILVTYAKQDDKKHDDVSGSGNGFIDVFDTNGNLLRRLASGGTLNSPWRLVLAPSGFGTFSNDLLVGNFGDGRISAFDPTTGSFLGQLSDSKGSPITIEGLWGLSFGNGSAAGSVQTLFFTAGIQHESHGLFGSLTTAPGASSASTVPSALPRTGEPVPVASTILLGFAVLGAGLYVRGSLLGRRVDSRESGRRKTTV